jgi:hypothetical protein
MTTRIRSVIPGRPAGVSKVKEYFNTAAFVPATIGTFGNIGRNSLRGPGYADVDTSVFKNLFTGERVSAQFQAEAFNTFNRVNFGNPANGKHRAGGHRVVRNLRTDHQRQLAERLSIWL